MKANDLRIGNWIYNPVQKIDFQVDITTLSNIYFDEQSKLKPRFEPTPLTEEWLLKMGFEKSVDTTNLFVKIENINEVQYEITFNEKVGCSLYAEEFWLKDDVKYVYQLQNLYYALTNEELSINL